MCNTRCHYQFVYDEEWSLDDYEYSDIAAAIDVLLEGIPVVYEDSRERSLALTKLEECQMWLERANIK